MILSDHDYEKARELSRWWGNGAEDNSDFTNYAAAMFAQTREETFDIVRHIERQIEWSKNTFGPAQRTKGVLDHIRKELKEVEAAPNDITEWVDIIILAVDGAWRAGHSAKDIVKQWLTKQIKNELRKWPDWRLMSEDQAIEHDRSVD